MLLTFVLVLVLTRPLVLVGYLEAALNVVKGWRLRADVKVAVVVVVMVVVVVVTVVVVVG